MTRKQYLGLLLIVPLLTVSLASTFTTISPANALIQRDFSYLNDNHITVLTGETNVCGDHMCAPGEWDKLQASLVTAQMGQGGRNPTQSEMTTVPMNTGMQESNMSSSSNMQEPTMTTENTMRTGNIMTTQDMGSVLKLSNANLPIVIPLVMGLYDGKSVFYITTEASDSGAASALTNFTGFPVTFAPTLAKTPLGASANIYLFKNGIKGPGIMGFQPQVVDSIPGDAQYSPLWRVNVVEWKNPANATTLGSEDDILAAEANGQVTVTPTHIVVNCPIIKWGGNNDGTILAGEMKIRDSITETGGYGSAQLLGINAQNTKATFVAHRGFAPDGSTIYYITTDASQKGAADSLGVVDTNKTGATIPTSSSADLFVFSNGIAGSGPLGFQSAIASSKAGDQYYSPIWRIQVVTWNDPTNATVLENTHDLNSKSGQTTTMLAGVVVNCPAFSVDTVYTHMQ